MYTKITWRVQNSIAVPKPVSNLCPKSRQKVGLQYAFGSKELAINRPKIVVSKDWSISRPKIVVLKEWSISRPKLFVP